MKRSEMISILQACLEDSNTDMAESVLACMESTGMLPPIWEGMCQIHWVSAEPEVFRVFTWEPEDE